jgi:tape measure domain-containing protein
MATTVDEILVRFLGDTTDFDRARTRFARGLQQIGRAGTMAGAAVTAGFGAIVGGSAAAAASLEQTTIAYDVLVGNIEKSRKLLRDMEQFAKISPFDVGEVEMAGKRLMAMGFAAKDIIPTLKDVGDVTAGIGIGGGRFERIIHNLAQVKTQGKLTARELRDFAVNGVPLLDALATSIEGLSPNLMEARAQIHDMIRRGQISDMQVLRAFRRMASEGGKFADLMFKQSKTFLGMLSNIRDSLLITAREIGQVFLPT